MTGRRAVINVIGVAAGLGGAYFLYETGGALRDLVFISRGMSKQPAGLAAPAIAITGGLSVLEIIAFGVLAAILLGISAWALEPRRRWRQWRYR
jgi:hypothetical protein